VKIRIHSLTRPCRGRSTNTDTPTCTWHVTTHWHNFESITYEKAM